MMYLEGLGFNSIGRLLGVSHVAVIGWIKKYGSQLSEIKNERPVAVVELDEMHSFIMQKKTIIGYGLQLVERENNTLISLLGTGVQKQEKHYGKKIKDIEVGVYCSDYWKSYAEFYHQKNMYRAKQKHLQ